MIVSCSRRSAARWAMPSGRFGRCSASAAQITAEVTGRLNQALGGVRVVKTYTAERREDLVFTKGAHRLFRNIAKSMTGVSATTAFSSVVIGAIGIVMIIVGGRAIVAGTMTLGDLVRSTSSSRRCWRCRSSRLRRSGRRSPRRSPGSIAFTRSSMTAREDADDANARGADAPARRHRVRARLVRVQPGRAGPEGRVVQCARGHDHRARGVVRVGQEHADQPRDGVQPADRAASFESTAATSRSCG